MSGIYLTIDLDYFMDHRTTRAPNQFFRKVLALDCPIVVIASHQLVVRYANKSGCRTIVNVDWHSDIVDPPCQIRRMEFGEGTWANYIRWKKTGAYVWRHPHKKHKLGSGYCHCQYDPFKDPGIAGWKSIQRRQGLAGVLDGDIREVCICLSPYWTNVRPVRDVLFTIGRKDWLAWHLKAESDWHNQYDSWPDISHPKSYRLPKNLELKKYDLPFP